MRLRDVLVRVFRHRPGTATRHCRSAGSPVRYLRHLAAEPLEERSLLAAGILVSPTSGLVTTEAGGTATFTVVLASQPLSNVEIRPSSSDATEGRADSSRLIFTPTNWAVPKTVTVRGINDIFDDGDVAYMVRLAPALSSDPSYRGLDAADVAVTNQDNDDPAGITVAPTSGLVTTEAGGTATFTIVLNSQPASNVQIRLASSDTTEGVALPNRLIFTPTNWATPQTVTVYGVNDTTDDGDVAYTILTAPATSSDPNYRGLNADDVAVTNQNIFVPPGITVTPTSGLVTTEAGGTATFTVVLNSRPVSNVEIRPTSSDPTEGVALPNRLIFTPTNWATPQTVTVYGVNDTIDDGDVAYTILTAPAISSDPNYRGLDADDVAVINQDNDDPPGITVTPTSGLVTTEAGGTATFTVVLVTQPVSNVEIRTTSSDPSEGVALPSRLIFTPTNWATPQTVTVYGVNDTVNDGDVAYTILTAPAISSDPNYRGLNADDVAITNQNIFVPPGITVTPTSGLETTEAGGTATFTVVLASRPVSNVEIRPSSSDPSEGVALPNRLIFTPTNWATPQTVTVYGINDTIDDGDVAYTIFTAPAISSDPQYRGLDAADVSATNQDDELPLRAAGLSAPRAEGQRLTAAALRPIVAEAAERWAATGLTAAQRTLLGATRCVVQDLGGSTLGVASAEGTILLDDDAAGFGWFVDPTPALDEEFSILLAAGAKVAAPASEAFVKMDLLTVVLHEMGHVLGRTDQDSTTAPEVLMADRLRAGVRRDPGGATVRDALFAGLAEETLRPADEIGFPSRPPRRDDWRFR